MSKNTLGSWHTWRTARRRHRCTSGRNTSDCLSVIDSGARYCRGAMAPNDGAGWLNSNLCPPCAATYQQTDPMGETP